MESDLRKTAFTLGIGAAGGLAAALLSFPAPYLIGPALLTTVAGFLGMRLGLPAWLTNLCFVIVGISMGASVTPDIVQAAKSWPASFILLAPAIMILFYAAYAVLRNIFGYDRHTAILAASPGHLSFIISLSAGTRGDVASVSIIQSVRVLALTLLVPVIVQVFDLAGAAPPVAVNPMPVAVLAAEMAGAALTGLVFLRLRFPAALLLGGVAVSVSTHMTGLAAGGVPSWLSMPTYIVLGCLIGSRFSGVSVLALRTAFLAGGVVTVIVMVLAAVISLGVAQLTGVPINAVLIAFAPGGLETMAAMAVMMHADATYVGAHHVMRLLFLSVFMPLVIRSREKALT